MGCTHGRITTHRSERDAALAREADLSTQCEGVGAGRIEMGRCGPGDATPTTKIGGKENCEKARGPGARCQGSPRDLTGSAVWHLGGPMQRMHVGKQRNANLPLSALRREWNGMHDLKMHLNRTETATLSGVAAVTTQNHPDGWPLHASKPHRDSDALQGSGSHHAESSESPSCAHRTR